MPTLRCGSGSLPASRASRGGRCKASGCSGSYSSSMSVAASQPHGCGMGTGTGEWAGVYLRHPMRSMVHEPWEMVDTGVMVNPPPERACAQGPKGAPEPQGLPAESNRRAGWAPVTVLLEELEARAEELTSEVAQVIVVVPSRSAAVPPRARWAFPVLVDDGARIHRDVGATDNGGRAVPALFVTDRFRASPSRLDLILLKVYIAVGSRAPMMRRAWTVSCPGECSRFGRNHWSRDLCFSRGPRTS